VIAAAEESIFDRSRKKTL